MVHPGARASGLVEAETFRPPRALGVIVGGAFTLWAAFIALVAGVLAGGGAVEFTTFLAWVVVALFAGLTLVFGWWTVGLARLAYQIDDESLRIRWCGGEVVVPIADIQRVVPGRTVGEESVTGLNWWGCHIGRGLVTALGPTLFFATHNRPEDNVFVITPGRVYGLTVPDEVAFAEACSRRPRRWLRARRAPARRTPRTCPPPLLERRRPVVRLQPRAGGPRRARRLPLQPVPRPARPRPDRLPRSHRHRARGRALGAVAHRRRRVEASWR